MGKQGGGGSEGETWEGKKKDNHSKRFFFDPYYMLSWQHSSINFQVKPS
jgi:hypothetical protein